MAEETKTGAGRLGRRFWLLVTSSGLSNLADGLFALALPLVAVQYTRSPGLVSGLEVVRTLPWLVLALVVGALVDRGDRRRAMIGANTARAVVVALPAGAIVLGVDGLWVLYLVAVGTGVAEVVYDTASQTILPQVVDRRQLSRANGRLFAVEYGAQQFVGPPLAGALVAAGAVAAFTVPAGLWVVAVVALLGLRGRFSAAVTGPRERLVTDIREGLSFLWGHRTLRSLAVMVGVANLTTSATFPLLVLFAVGEGSAMGMTEPAFGVLLLVGAGGGLLGSLVADRVERLLGTARTLTASISLMVVFVGAPAVTSSPVLVAVAMAVGSFGIMVWNIPTVSFRQDVTPDRLLGRLNSAYRLLAWGTRPLGALLGGVLGELLGVRAVFGVMAVVTLTLFITNRQITDERLAEDRARAERAEAEGTSP